MVIDPIVKKITLCVFFIHLFLLSLFSFNISSSKPRTFEKMRVYTKNEEMIVHQKKSETKEIAAPLKEKPSKAQKVKKEESKSLVKSKEPSSKIAKAPASLTSKKQETSLSKKKEDQELLEELIHQLGSFEETPSLKIEHKEFNVPLFVSSLSCDSSTLSKQQESYEEKVAFLLQNQLELPEQGETTVSIVIDRLGKIEKIEVIATKSKRNADFLKKRLQELSFPCFNEYGLNQNRIEFKVVFRNVENFGSLR